MVIDCAEVSEALAVLYDGWGLAQTKLCTRFPFVDSKRDPVERAHHMRTILLEAIEFLQPSRPGSFLSSTVRSYQVLTLHFVDGLSLSKIAEELHISRRQAYRDLSCALETLSEFLEARDWDARDISAQASEQTDTLVEELDRLAAHTSAVDLHDLMTTSVELVANLGQSLGVHLVTHFPPKGTIVYASEDLLRHTLVKLLSIATRHAHDGHASVHVQQDHDISICAHLVPASRVDLASELSDLRNMAQAQGLDWDSHLDCEGRMTMRLTVPRSKKLILIIEDNESTAHLYARYLADMHDWEIMTTADPVRGIDLAKERSPDLILLDVLMPGLDGWSVLQRLRTESETQDTPIVVCSVFDEIELAKALGASGYLKKPVSQQVLQREMAQHLHPTSRSA